MKKNRAGFVPRAWYCLAFLMVIINVFLSASWLLKGEIHYDIDISRDFLVLSEAVRDRKPFLIGPHSGIIAGVFHGPLWYYFNLPAFILGHGNPVSMGWFWWGLSLVTLLIIYHTTKSLFGKGVAIVAIVFYSANSIINPMDNLKQFFNPYGAVMLSPLYYLLLVKYLKTKKVWFLVFSLLTVGAIIQFQMAFGVPILIVSFLHLLWFCYRNKLIKHLFAFLVLLFPLSTFIVFDLRHGFLQTKSLINYFFLGSHDGTTFLFFMFERFKSIFTDVSAMLVPGKITLASFVSILFLLIIFKYNLLKKIEYSLFIYLYFSYWLFLFLFRGWTGNYYWPFLPILIIVLSSFVKVLPKKVSAALFVFLVGWNIYGGVTKIRSYPKEITRRGINSWTYNKLLAEFIYKDADGDFGYFVFTPDRWVYNQKYALVYLQSFYPKKKSYPSVKNPLTYLLVVDPPKGRPDIDPVGWRITDIGIKRESTEAKKIDVTTIYKYRLTEEERLAPQNPYLMDTTFFR